MKVAVIGGGIFGCTAALELSHAHTVHLYERRGELMSGASSHNQFRLHRGYHYPRSPETGQESRDGLKLFEMRYPRAVISRGRQYYGVALQDTQTNAQEFIDFLDSERLYHNHVFDRQVTNPDNVAICRSVLEPRYDPFVLKQVVEWELNRAGVQVFVNREVNPKGLFAYDKVVIAAYADTGRWTEERYQFEVVEKPVIWLHPDDEMQYTGIVIMDGPFCSVDPFAETGLHVMGHVALAIHASNYGTEPKVPVYLRQSINQGVIQNPGFSLAKTMLEDGSKYIPCLKRATIVGSMFTIRTVLPNMEDTDARPTLVHAIDDKTIRIFSGKVSTCVTAAKQVRALLDPARTEMAA